MILKLITTSELFFVIFICYHILKIFPYGRLINFFLQIIDIRNIFSLMISNPTTFSSIIALIGLTIILDPAVKIDIINLVLNILGSIISGGPYALIAAAGLIVFLVVKDFFENSPLIMGIKKIIDIIEKDLKPAIKYITCLTEFPDGYEDCVVAHTDTLGTHDIDTGVNDAIKGFQKEIGDARQFVEPHCTDESTLMNFIKNNTTCSSNYVNESSNSPKIGFGCSKSITANRILKSIEPSATDLTFRNDTRDKLTTYNQDTIMNCDSFINIARFTPTCNDAYSTIRNTATTGNPPYIVPDNLDNTTYSTVVGCTADSILNSEQQKLNEIVINTPSLQARSTTDTMENVVSHF